MFAPTQLPLAVIEGILTVVIMIGLETYAKPSLRALALTGRRHRYYDKEYKDCYYPSCDRHMIAVIPVAALRGADFGGSDDAGSVMVEEIHGEYEPWFTPVLETAIGGRTSGELESLLFCVQTGIGVGVIAFFMGRFVERKKWMKKMGEEDAPD